MKLRDRLFLVMVAVLPLHTVYLSAWVSWKPYLVLVAVLAAADVLEGLRQRRWPWHPRLSAMIGVFLAVAAVGLPVPAYREQFIRLLLALLVGGLVLVVSERRLRTPGLADRTLRVVFWTAGAMAVTGLLISVILVGVAGNDPINYLTGAVGYDLPLIDKVAKPAYLLSHFLALSNWHQDPGYGAAWGVLWAALALLASIRGQGSGRPELDGVLLGGLWLSVILAFSRTGWAALLIATTVLAIAALRRRLITGGQLFRSLGAATLTTVLLLTALFLIDVEDVGADLDVQFAFRFQQGFDLLAGLTGLFEGSESFEDLFDESEPRAAVWPAYWEMFVTHPVTGGGLGVGWETNSIGQEPHNLGLELGAETGLIGIAAFVVLIITIVRSGAGLVGGLGLLAAFLPAMTQTVLFEPTWWFASALWMAGKVGLGGPARLESVSELGEITPQNAGD
ncbi:MAG: O-antigen ligase family protein [Actinomycetota bacterium]